jgi:hypothetical protein
MMSLLIEEEEERTEEDFGFVFGDHLLTRSRGAASL